MQGIIFIKENVLYIDILLFEQLVLFILFTQPLLSGRIWHKVNF